MANRYRHLDGQAEYYPFAARTQLRRRQKRRKRLLWVLVSLFFFSILALFLRQTVFHGGQPRLSTRENPFPEAVVTEPVNHPDAASGALFPVLPLYQELFMQNPDLIGWVSVPACNIDYPVVQTPGNNEKYLRLGFDGLFSNAGTPFLDERCSVTVPTANWMIHGHNVGSGIMFSDLLKYRDEDFYRKNPTFRFDTIYQTGTWQILAVLETTVDNGGDFKYYTFFDAAGPTEWLSFYEHIKAESLYDTGVQAQWGDQLLTLSTCGRSIPTDRRFAVIAKRIETVGDTGQ